VCGNAAAICWKTTQKQLGNLRLDPTYHFWFVFFRRSGDGQSLHNFSREAIIRCKNISPKRKQDVT
jgi:hypothetical protein